MPTKTTTNRPRFVCEAVEGLGGIFATPSWSSWGPYLAREMKATWQQIPPHVRKLLSDHWLHRWMRRRGKDATPHPLTVVLLPEVIGLKGKPVGGSYHGRLDLMRISGESVLCMPPPRLHRLLAHELSHCAVLACTKTYGGENAPWRNERLVDAVADRWGF